MFRRFLFFSESCPGVSSFLRPEPLPNPEPRSRVDTAGEPTCWNLVIERVSLSRDLPTVPRKLLSPLGRDIDFGGWSGYVERLGSEPRPWSVGLRLWGSRGGGSRGGGTGPVVTGLVGQPSVTFTPYVYSSPLRVPNRLDDTPPSRRRSPTGTGPPHQG